MGCEYKEQEPNTWDLDDAREDFMHDVYNTLHFLPTNEEANRIIDSLDRVTEYIEKQPCEDAISRQAYIERYRKWGYSEYGRKMNNEALAIRVAMSLPPVTPQPKMGHWEYSEKLLGHVCSACGNPAYWNEDKELLTNYCPNCGAKMTEPQESEDKE
jgi:hypothetical protein